MNTEICAIIDIMRDAGCPWGRITFLLSMRGYRTEQGRYICKEHVIRWIKQRGYTYKSIALHFPHCDSKGCYRPVDYRVLVTDGLYNHVYCRLCKLHTIDSSNLDLSDKIRPEKIRNDILTVT